MSRLASHEVLAGLFNASAEEIQKCMSSDYTDEDLLIASQLHGLKQEYYEQNRSVSRGKYHSSDLYHVTEYLVDREDDDGCNKEEDLLLDTKLPDMWSWNFIGLYSQYAAVGKVYFVYPCPLSVFSDQQSRLIVWHGWNICSLLFLCLRWSDQCVCQY